MNTLETRIKFLYSISYFKHTRLYIGFIVRILGVKVVEVRRLDGTLEVPPVVSTTGLPTVPAGPPPPTKDIKRFETFCRAWRQLTTLAGTSATYTGLSALTCSLRLGAA